ncbi:hypothetical protein FRB90_008165 [Tulasnella sp. 427]|nr:hypothetical protein FRB90_008165 [Tulasnella sp. 427]
MDSGGPKAGSSSAGLHHPSTPKKSPSDQFVVLVDPPSDKMKKSYVRTPDRAHYKTSRSSPAYVVEHLEHCLIELTGQAFCSRFARPVRRKGLSKTTGRHIRSPNDDEPEEVDSDSGAARAIGAGFGWLLDDD